MRRSGQKEHEHEEDDCEFLHVRTSLFADGLGAVLSSVYSNLPSRFNCVIRLCLDGLVDDRHLKVSIFNSCCVRRNQRIQKVFG